MIQKCRDSLRCLGLVYAALTVTMLLPAALS